MTWASWTTIGIYARPGVVRTEEVGVIDGDLSVHTTWTEGQAHVAVQYTGATDWFTMAGSPVPCGSEEESRNFHQAVVEAMRDAEEARPSMKELFRQE